MKKRSNRFFSTTKNEGFFTERKYLEKQLGILLEGIGAQKEYNEEGSWPEYLQFVLIIRQPIFLARILKTEIGSGEFSF
ncbi:MAG TPA: hypothetical protein VLZ10_19595 [Thermodesulfobacteriota bacterium]|nr:hypothetical protein [Thermodesulfobacteriota bacterium]